MSFNIYPAIDLRGGQCVRLFQGDYGQETVYGDPIEIAKQWQKRGATWLHLVDLDGAKEGAPIQMEVIAKIVKVIDIPVQLGGGIRTLETIQRYFQLGVSRLILGTAALENRELLKQALELNPEGIAVGIDARNGYVATRGWLETSQVPAIELGKELVKMGVRRFIFTDIAKDGTLTGPNIVATRQFAKETKGEVIASGGVSQIEDLIQLKQYEEEGIGGAIVGKALYTGNLSFEEALQRIKEA
ncbi:1-(5-phosphoribosyl)-5-[(5-phosphoribosylamino)methylideneamino]imidazole-4-carboxamide isomerase [Tepidibacillus sp. LV47]|uniref:1-(5-phosphoribosyl)-5-[(5- phosphoribosylamino)methylideneamino]imidazole-4- carboxamide isomerase n=1 Tax=Tepidibacillus sp. LV47 TaxID=3398228 RepID=UPI003AAAB2AA